MAALGSKGKTKSARRAEDSARAQSTKATTKVAPETNENGYDYKHQNGVGSVSVPKVAGVGLKFKVRAGLLVVEAVKSDGPCDRAGLLPGDVIDAVDGTAILHRKDLGDVPAVEYYARVTRRISGPIGSTVCIRVRRPALEEEGAPIRLHDFEVRPLPPPPPALPCARRPPEVVQALVRRDIPLPLGAPPAFSPSSGGSSSPPRSKAATPTALRDDYQKRAEDLLEMWMDASPRVDGIATTPDTVRSEDVMKLRDEASLGGSGGKHLGSTGNAQAWKVQDDEALLSRLEAEGQRALSHRLSSSRSKRPIKNGLSPWGSAIKVTAGALDESGDPDGWTPRHSPSRGNAFTATTSPHVDKDLLRGRGWHMAPHSASSPTYWDEVGQELQLQRDSVDAQITRDTVNQSCSPFLEICSGKRL